MVWAMLLDTSIGLGGERMSGFVTEGPMPMFHPSNRGQQGVRGEESRLERKIEG